MKTIGLIGGMSWESTVVYYRLLNEIVRARLGGLHSAELLMWSFDFHEVEACQAAGRWDQATALMVEAARRVERGGAELLLICTNTMHKMAAEVQAAVSIPLCTRWPPRCRRPSRSPCCTLPKRRPGPSSSGACAR
jgi:aspartate racemase